MLTVWWDNRAVGESDCKIYR